MICAANHPREWMRMLIENTNNTHPGRRHWSRILISSCNIVGVPRCCSPCYAGLVRPSATSIHPLTACDSSPSLSFSAARSVFFMSPLSHTRPRRNGTNYTAFFFNSPHPHHSRLPPPPLSRASDCYPDTLWRLTTVLEGVASALEISPRACEYAMKGQLSVLNESHPQSVSSDISTLFISLESCHWLVSIICSRLLTPHGYLCSPRYWCY